MQLESIKYSQHDGEPREWRIEELRLGSTTLLVGKNASGKSRTLNLIHGLARLLTGDMKPTFRSGHYVASFRDENAVYEYQLKYRDSHVEIERFSKDGTELLSRGAGGVGKIYAEKSGDFMEFQTPEGELTAVTRRDKIQHPFFEVLHNWGQRVRYFQFGTPLGKDVLAMLVKDAVVTVDPRDTNAVIGIFKKGVREFGENFSRAIVDDMARVDYALDEVGIRAPESLIVQNPSGSEIVGMYVKERRLNVVTEQAEMSQGMFRVLSIIIQLNYSQFSDTPSCIIIDDIGEGLDFERSCALIEVLVEKAAHAGVQIIMATNDRFVMNKVPLENWAVIKPMGAVCKYFTYSNSKKLFEEFKFTGLNNFDFFSTDFLGENLAENEKAGSLR